MQFESPGLTHRPSEEFRLAQGRGAHVKAVECIVLARGARGRGLGGRGGRAGRRGRDGGRGPVSESAGNAAQDPTHEAARGLKMFQEGLSTSESVSGSARVSAIMSVGGARACTGAGDGLARVSESAGSASQSASHVAESNAQTLRDGLSGIEIASVSAGGDGVGSGLAVGASVGPGEAGSTGAPAGRAQARRVQAEFTWTNFWAEFNAKFFFQENVDCSETRFLELAHGEEAQVKRFLRGLRPDLRTLCGVCKYSTRAKLVETAKGIEEDMREQVVVVSPNVQSQRPQQQVIPDNATSLRMDKIGSSLGLSPGSSSFEREGGRLVYHAGRPTLGSLVISLIHVEAMIGRGCKAYLATNVMPEYVGGVAVRDIRVVQDFEVVFQSLQGLLLSRFDPFTIELEPGTTPLSKTPYRMALAELAELKKQLEDLMDKGFIQPSSSPWGASVLFVKRRMGISGCASITWGLTESL
ncbi:hypothetical protein AALP_AA4G089800 [Arabis alpina]|uniref:Retrotransposon gag domain-containing protein n=1 Tax=Arabis alpina TaxID=50452 RepID=A0A087H238_ARAAL|nr:hypothetical protein AALP_AA4G089800 [Arabis alpina]